jgi:CRP-like cAMP-binding protein
MNEEKTNPPLTAKLRPLAVVRRFGRGQFLFAAGDPADGFYVLQSGEVRVTKMDDARMKSQAG